MALVAGSVSVAAGEIVTGSDLALALYTADAATTVLPVVPTLHSTAAPWRPERPVSASDVAAVQAGRLAALQETARRATAYATALVAYITTNGRAIVQTTDSVGRTPNPNNPATAIDPPTVAVRLIIQ